MDSYITRAEYEEHNRRMEDEHKRINHRLADLEELTGLIHEIATNTNNMSREQKAQGERLEKLDNKIMSFQQKPTDTWTKIKNEFLITMVRTGAAAAAVGFVMMIANYIK